MPLIDLQTDLKSLRYGRDQVGGGSSGEPFITTSVDTLPGDTGGADFLLRSNVLNRIGQDATRLFKYFKTGKGLKFIAKQNVLSRSGVKAQASGFINDGIYLPLGTLGQAAVNPFGGHLLKQGINPFRDTTAASSPGLLGAISSFEGVPAYLPEIEKITENDTNRLVQLFDNKIVTPLTKQPSNNLFGKIANIFGSNQPGISNILGLGGNPNNISPLSTQLIAYGGGPGSVLGVGRTVLNLAEKKYPSAPLGQENGFGYLTLTGGQIAAFDRNVDNRVLDNFVNTLIASGSQQVGQDNFLQKSPSYIQADNKTLEGRVNLGDPGKKSRKRTSYSTANEPLDLINYLPLYKSEGVTQNPVKNDLVKFRFGVIDNKDPKLKTYIHFRALIDAFDDNYTAEWTPQRYMGRGEDFYRYGAFNRTINLSFTVVAQSKGELMPMYKKLNYLASSLAPDYTEYGYMAGNLVTMTFGGYCFEQPGFITGMSIGVPEEATYEIAINEEGESDPTVKELPMMLKITGLSFTPIHNFVPKVQTLEFDDKGALTSYGPEQFIALSNTGDSSAAGTNNYDDVDTFDPASENKPFRPIPPKNDPNSPKTAGAEKRNVESIDVSGGINYDGI